MPTKTEREYYTMGFRDGYKSFGDMTSGIGLIERTETRQRKKTRKLSAWQKFVKTQSKRPKYKKMNNTRRLKAIGVAWRKTPAGKKKRR